MNREEALIQLEDLLYNFKNYIEVETTEEDVKALEFTIKEIKRTAPEVPVQEQYGINKKNCPGIFIENRTIL